MPHVCNVHDGFGASNCGQVSVGELPVTIARFGRRRQGEFTIHRQGAADLSKIRHLTGESRRLRRPLDDLNVHRQYLCIQLRSMQDTLDHEEFKFSTHASNHYLLTK